MQINIYDTAGNIIGNSNVNEVNFDGNKKLSCAVCNDISSFVGKFCEILDKDGNSIFIGNTQTYSEVDGKRIVEINHIYEYLKNIILSNIQYSGDLGGFFQTIVDGIKNEMDFNWIDYSNIPTTGINVSYNIASANGFMGLAYVDSSSVNHYLTFDFGGKTSIINLISSQTAYSIDDGLLFNVGYSSIGGNIINYVEVSNGNDINVVEQDAASISEYGKRMIKIVDVTIKDVDTARQIAQEKLNPNPEQIVNSITLNKFIPDIHKLNKLINVKGKDYYIAGFSIKDGYVTYLLSDRPINYFGTITNNVDNLINYVTEIVSLASESLDFSVTGTFTGTDYQTLSWSGVNINYSDGTSDSITDGSYTLIDNVEYVYHIKGESTIRFTSNPIDALGSGRKLIGYVQKNSDTSKTVGFTIFNSSEEKKIISGDEIISNSITGNEIAANTITAQNVKFLDVSQMQNGGIINTGVIIDNNGIRGYKSGALTFLLDINGNAKFSGTIGSADVETGGTLKVFDNLGNGIQIENSTYPMISFYDNNNKVGEITGQEYMYINPSYGIQGIKHYAQYHVFTTNQSIDEVYVLLLIDSNKYGMLYYDGSNSYTPFQAMGVRYLDGGGVIMRRRGTRSSEPTGPHVGDVYKNYSDGRFYIYTDYARREAI